MNRYGNDGLLQVLEHEPAVAPLALLPGLRYPTATPSS